MSKRYNCDVCGKFISEKDLDSGKLKQVEYWNWDKTELNGVGWYCSKCTAKDANQNKSEGSK